jgi:hypothetical protein
MNNNPCLTLAIKELAEAGVHQPEIANGSKHLQLRWTTPRGQRRCFAVSGTPSDWRSPQNTARDYAGSCVKTGPLKTTTHLGHHPAPAESN